MIPTREAYKEKLRAFNATTKYKQECDFLMRLMLPTNREKILDYGCGRGHLVWHMVESGVDAYGYDFINYREKDDIFRFRSEYLFKFDKVYFMHSLAHVPNITEKLCTLREGMNEGGKVYVITPNGEWVIHRDNQIDGYKPDPTVIQHFYLTDLQNLFSKAGFKINISGQFGAVTDSLGGQYINERLFLEATV